MLGAEDCEILGLRSEPRAARRPSAVSQVLRAVAREVAEGAGSQNPFGGEQAGFRMRVATGIELRERAYRLAREVYRKRGICPPMPAGWAPRPTTPVRIP